jgi:hypothetical protein
MDYGSPSKYHPGMIKIKINNPKGIAIKTDAQIGKFAV